MPTALQAARQEFSAAIGATTPGVAEWASSAVNAANTLTAITLARNGYDSDDYFGGGVPGSPEWWAFVNNLTDNLRVARRVTDYTGATGVVTSPGGSWVTTGAESPIFELHKFHPIMLENALDKARVDAKDYIHQELENETVFTAPGQQTFAVPSAILEKPHRIYLSEEWPAATFSENILSNASFQNGTTSWTAAGCTIAAEVATSAPINMGALTTDSLKVTATDSTVGTVLQTISTPGTHDGLRLIMSIWVYCLTASRLRATVVLNGTASNSASYHGGSGWEMLSVTVNPTVAITTLTAGVRIDSGTAIVVYADEAILTAGHGRRSYPKWAPLYNWDYNNGLVVFRYQLPSPRQLRLEGIGLLTMPTTETGEFEIAAPQTEILYAFAAVRLYREMMMMGAPSRAYYGPLLEDAERWVNRVKREHGMVPQPVLRGSPDWGR